jgi:hypothetical protein
LGSRSGISSTSCAAISDDVSVVGGDRGRDMAVGGDVSVDHVVSVAHDVSVAGEVLPSIDQFSSGDCVVSSGDVSCAMSVASIGHTSLGGCIPMGGHVYMSVGSVDHISSRGSVAGSGNVSGDVSVGSTSHLSMS